MKLDLGVLAQETLDITLLDGSIVAIKKPCKGLLVEINKTDMELSKTSNFEEIVSKLENIVAKILSNNTKQTVFVADDLEKSNIDYTMQMAIFKAYMQFVTQATANPN